MTELNAGSKRPRPNQHVEIYRSEEWDFRGASEDLLETRKMWRWRLRAGNGRPLSESSDAYNEPRDLVHGLELSFPGYRLDGNAFSGWRGWSLVPVGPLDMASLNDPRSIPVRVPKGTEDLWAARRKR